MEKKNERRKNVQPNRLLIFHGPTIYGAVSTSNLLLSKAEQGNGCRGRITSATSANEMRNKFPSFEYRIKDLGNAFVFHPSVVFNSQSVATAAAPVVFPSGIFILFNFQNMFTFSFWFRFGNVAYTMCVPLRNESFTRVRNKQKRRKDTP